MNLETYAREQARAALAQRGKAPEHVVATVNRALRANATGEGGDAHALATARNHAARLVDLNTTAQ